jgi:hypothetical protein
VDFSHSVLARLYEHIEPLDRGSRYEDPLQAVLEEQQAGRVTGGGSQLNESGSIDFVDIEIELADLDGALALAISALENAGAPRGSEIVEEGGGVLREFGTHECLAIYLDGTSLPDDVYATLDFDQVVEEIGRSAGPDSYHGFVQGAEETGIMLFGPNADEMFARVEPLLRRLPIGQNARVVVREGKKRPTRESSESHATRVPE